MKILSLLYILFLSQNLWAGQYCETLVIPKEEILRVAKLLPGQEPQMQFASSLSVLLNRVTLPYDYRHAFEKQVDELLDTPWYISILTSHVRRSTEEGKLFYPEVTIRVISAMMSKPQLLARKEMFELCLALDRNQEIYDPEGKYDLDFAKVFRAAHDHVVRFLSIPAEMRETAVKVDPNLMMSEGELAHLHSYLKSIGY